MSRLEHVRGAGERGGDPGPELLLQHRHHPVPDPGPGEPGVVVVRVGPEREALGHAGRLRLRPGEVEQGPPERVEGAAHAGDRAAARAAGEPEQHGLGLVVEGVAEEDDAGRRSARRPPPGRRTGPPGPPPRVPARRLDVDPGRDGLVRPRGPPSAARRGPRARRSPPGARGRRSRRSRARAGAAPRTPWRRAAPASRRLRSRPPGRGGPPRRRGPGGRRAGPRRPRGRAPCSAVHAADPGVGVADLRPRSAGCRARPTRR